MPPTAQLLEHSGCLEPGQTGEQSPKLAQDAAVVVGIGDDQEEMLSGIVAAFEVVPASQFLQVCEPGLEFQLRSLAPIIEDDVPCSALGPAIWALRQRDVGAPRERRFYVSEQAADAIGLGGVADGLATWKHAKCEIEAENRSQGMGVVDRQTLEPT
ncbi:MAG: hypothetical protein ABI452_04485 [Candidatus Limnocylindrales bacterium]